MSVHQQSVHIKQHIFDLRFLLLGVCVCHLFWPIDQFDTVCVNANVNVNVDFRRVSRRGTMTDD